MKNIRARGITRDGKPVFSEEVEHVAVVNWLTANGVYCLHIPNEVPRMRGDRLAQIIWFKKQKRKGAKPGASDIFIPKSPPAVPEAKGTFIEMKALDGKKPSDDQMEFGDRMVQYGYIFGWHRGAEAAIEWLESLGYGQRLP